MEENERLTMTALDAQVSPRHLQMIKAAIPLSLIHIYIPPNGETDKYGVVVLHIGKPFCDFGAGIGIIHLN